MMGLITHHQSYGKGGGFAYLQRRLMAFWHPKAHMELVALENNYFLVKFMSNTDYEFAKFRGP